MIAAAYRDVIFGLLNNLVQLLLGRHDYNEELARVQKIRSEHHQLSQQLVLQGIAPGGENAVSPKKRASAQVATTYHEIYAACVHPHKSPRKAAEDVGVTLAEGEPVCHQATSSCHIRAALFHDNQRRKYNEAAQRGEPITLRAAAKLEKADAERTGRYLVHDLDGNPVSQDNQVRAMLDPVYAATGVPSSALAAA